MKFFDLPTISSCSNSLVKALTALRQTKIREREGAFIFEGSKLFEEAIHWQRPLTHVLVTERWLNHAEAHRLKMFERFKGEKIFVTDAVMDKLTGQKQPEGIFCRAEKPAQSDFFLHNERLADFQAVVVLENVQDPGNVGTIIRTADAAGFSAVLTTAGTADCYNEKVLRASMGSVFHLPILQHLAGMDMIQALKSVGFTVIGSALTGSENDFRSPPQSIRPAVILGNESVGMTAEAQQLCDLLVRIPMRGHAESLNVSVAAGLMLYRFMD